MICVVIWIRNLTFKSSLKLQELMLIKDYSDL